ncbi:MAG TPA: Asp-tRNA(Asn)/Glu-tRNA(Gln) amidotransferase subunit GatB [bacterium]|nr:Asp-tRNA(Asn)/Glu-tRNA(Gln) amidotransferase subunit GatB [bacterium]
MKYIPVIGLEIHSQLKTNTKIFCGYANKFGAEQNTQTCPVCAGFPGVLPVLNEKAVEYCIKAGLALNCEIAEFSKFDRKNYFYPDLPKAYQISQYDKPICGKGYVEVIVNGEKKKIGITRIHLEEDAGKLVHSSDAFTMATNSFADYNRCGTPLIEIVSEPDMHSADDAYAYLQAVKHILEYIEVSDCNMEEGSLRCDANVSVMPEGSKVFGTKTELKNMNSFKAVKAAIEAEIKRQINELENGGKIIQETRLWDEASGQTRPMRSKEEAQDYKYFPESDLVELEISKDYVEKLKNELPELPYSRMLRFINDYSLPEVDAEVLVAEKAVADYFENAVKIFNQPKKIANWIMTELMKLLNEKKVAITNCKISPKQLAEMLQMIEKNVINGKIAKQIFPEMFETGKSAELIVKEKGLIQITDTAEIEKIVEETLAQNPEIVNQIKSGKDKAKGFLIGQIMKTTRGKANPNIVNEILAKKIENI